jgi:hypothetical protein
VTPTRFSARWWVAGRDGKVALVQPPNPALSIWLLSVVVGWTALLHGHRATTLDRLGTGALVVWALDEVVRGTSPARRILGAVVLVVQLGRLFG